MREQLAILATAVRFLTRLPVFGGVAYSDARFKAAARYYPLVGWLIGLLLAGFFLLLDLLWPQQLAALLVVATGVALTGGLHEDGFADFCDGLGSGGDKQRTLEIMRDSRIGSYGVIGLVLLLLAKVFTLAMLSGWQVLILLPLAHGFSRLLIYLALLMDAPASKAGLGQLVATGPVSAGALILVVLYLLPMLAGLLFVGACAALAVSALLLLVFWWIRRHYRRVLGGYNGDCLGALQQGGEIAVLLGGAACL